MSVDLKRFLHLGERICFVIVTYNEYAFDGTETLYRREPRKGMFKPWSAAYTFTVRACLIAFCGMTYLEIR